MKGAFQKYILLIFASWFLLSTGGVYLSVHFCSAMKEYNVCKSDKAGCCEEEKEIIHHSTYPVYEKSCCTHNEGLAKLLIECFQENVFRLVIRVVESDVYLINTESQLLLSSHSCGVCTKHPPGYSNSSTSRAVLQQFNC